MRSDQDKPAQRAWSDQIDALLGEQLRRIRGRFLLHGIGWMVAGAAACTVLYYLLDVGLQLPTPVRVIVTLGIVTYLGFALRRRVVYPMRRAFGREDVAIAIERRFPELRERLVSAFQLKAALAPGTAPRSLRDQSAAMIERVVADASAAVRSLPLGRVLDPRRTAKVWSAAAGFVFALGLAAALQPTQFRVFLQRAVGIGVDYPRRTQLHVELPQDVEGVRITESGDRRVDVLMSSGDDLPVLVRAEGVVPREVFLGVDGGRGLPSDISMTQRPGGRFRHVFRRVQGTFSFHAHGGDDPRGDLDVFVRTVDPPLVGTIDTELDFPAYTGLADETRSGGAIEAVVGTTAHVRVTATSPVQRAALRFLESGKELPLAPVRIEDDSGAGLTFGGTFVVTASDRYQVDLENAEGLTNPRPGMYPVIALEDHTPVGRVLVPGGDDINVVLKTGKLPIRIEAKDDYGVETAVAVLTTGRDATAETRRPLFESPEGAPVRSTVLTALVDVATIAGGEPAREGDVIGLELELVDNREPEPNVSELPRRQVHVVDPVELARRISSHFRRIRDQVETALDQQRAMQDALGNLLEQLPDPDAGRDPRLVGLQVGQSRVVATTRRVREQMMQVYDTTLFNGLEGADSMHAPRVQELYVDFHTEQESPEPYVPDFYRLVAAEQSVGRIGPMEKALDPILGMLVRSDSIVEERGAAAVEALDAAGVAASKDALRDLLTNVAAHQQAIEADLVALLSQLDEWNEFQDVVQQARALRDAQKDIEYRTRALQESK